jgi:hypothetical protein
MVAAVPPCRAKESTGKRKACRTTTTMSDTIRRETFHLGTIWYLLR